MHLFVVRCWADRQIPVGCIRIPTLTCVLAILRFAPHLCVAALQILGVRFVPGTLDWVERVCIRGLFYWVMGIAGSGLTSSECLRLKIGVF